MTTVEFLFKVGLSTCKKVGFICFNENPLKMLNNGFYFILIAFLLFRYLHFYRDVFGYVGKWLSKFQNL